MRKYNFELKKDKSKYLQIYNHIMDLILKKEIQANEKLPPIRKLAKYMGVNNTTVVKSYELLEKEGYVYKTVGSGTFASSLSNEKPNTVTEGEDIIHLDNGNPSTGIFPIEDFKSAVNMALTHDGSSIFEYDEGLGSEDLRGKIVEYLKTRNIDTEKENIQIISGAQQGIDIVCKGLINYSDVVFVEEPTYNGAIEVFKSRGAKIISIPMLDDGIDIGILKLKLEKIKPKLIYTMPNFQNPTGISYSTYKKKKLIELAEEYGFYIIEDDFISDFAFNSLDNNPLKSYDDKNRVIYIKSFSKILMPGLRIGVVEIPNELLQKVLWAKYSSDISTPGLIQRSMYYYMENFDWDEYLKNIENIYTQKYNFAQSLIKEKLSSKLNVRNSNGGINFFLELPRGYLSRDFTEFMRKKGVSMLPGTYFFDNLVDDRYFRINIARASIQELEKGISIISENLDEFLKEYKNKINLRSNRLFY
ncbi:PLP-dependent aminotransferase family protein [Asaccharospora irregularis]|uniref:DNA-binding transcriptional regulator, MocR family, contains an aminotransferase domain n=1 Tax=Asaccharospora irregularis DSM 2635 TaxID=1121321 RepID=A0A1M5P9H1_9FIRM|nr:PLP-dependent aminotransferase family protein [Asaccharospora irregularis]SHG98471.1 DNA-binding transcriptional regulator, MocR family, contains an aminotransferase domain [Asaccharospora irregularis DSM 2635]